MIENVNEDFRDYASKLFFSSNRKLNYCKKLLSTYIGIAADWRLLIVLAMHATVRRVVKTSALRCHIPFCFLLIWGYFYHDRFNTVLDIPSITCLYTTLTSPPSVQICCRWLVPSSTSRRRCLDYSCNQLLYWSVSYVYWFQ